jgi:hypothetical protein
MLLRIYTNFATYSTSFLVVLTYDVEGYAAEGKLVYKKVKVNINW